MPLDNIQKCAVLLMLLDQLRDQLEDEWNNALYTPVSRHSGCVDKEKCVRKRRDALADTEKRLMDVALLELDVMRCTCPATSEEVETTPHAIICLSTICSIFCDVSSGSRST